MAHCAANDAKGRYRSLGESRRVSQQGNSPEGLEFLAWDQITQKDFHLQLVHRLRDFWLQGVTRFPGLHHRLQGSAASFSTLLKTEFQTVENNLEGLHKYLFYRSLHRHHLHDERIINLSPLPPQVQDRRRLRINKGGIYGSLQIPELSNVVLLQVLSFRLKL